METGIPLSFSLRPGQLYESWQMRLAGGNWQASNGALFNIRHGLQRPAGWTSADAAGHSMLGGLVRYDECVRGMVEHAIRLIVNTTRREYLYPANHYASSSDLATRPAMGERFRLRADFEIPESWTIYEKAVCRALKKYGAIVTDNGGFFSISVAPDDRFPEEAFDNLRNMDINEFEVVQTTAYETGPRATGALAVEAGPNQLAISGNTVSLQGQLYDPGNSADVSWYLYEGPTEVEIDNPDQLEASVQLTAEGTYTFMLQAQNGIHSPAHDAVTVSVSSGEVELPEPVLGIIAAGSDMRQLRYHREHPQLFTYLLETSTDMETWAPSGLSPQIEAINGDEVRILYIDTGMLGEGRRYYRLRLSDE